MDQVEYNLDGLDKASAAPPSLWCRKQRHRLKNYRAQAKFWSHTNDKTLVTKEMVKAVFRLRRPDT